MKSPLSLAFCTVGLLCFTLGAPLAEANPLKSIGSSLKKAGNALNPFKKSEAKPATAAPAAAAPAPAPAAKAKPKPKPTAAKPTKPGPAKKKKPTAAASPKSTAAGDASKAAAAAGAAAAAAASAPDGKVDSTEFPAETAPGAAPSDTTDTPPAPPAAAAPVPLAQLPFGIPVMGRKGYVRSPYAGDQGMVDVNDIPAGAKVKCPFTGKVFRVP